MEVAGAARGEEEGGEEAVAGDRGTPGLRPPLLVGSSDRGSQDHHSPDHPGETQEDDTSEDRSLYII